MSLEITSRTHRSRTERGFTLVELAIVIVIIGVLASFGVPRFRDAVERSKAGESINYLSAIRSSQETYASREGTYASDLSLLDITIPPLKYFTVGTVSPGLTGDLEDSWSLTLTRVGASAGYGPYTVTFTEQGYDPLDSTIDGLPQINPIGGIGAST
ncbi:MAG: type II secretion system protein [Myxococcales bacterium]|nr:MAG: type II secretion system protein [Myxococcales bacterium]